MPEGDWELAKVGPATPDEVRREFYEKFRNRRSTVDRAFLRLQRVQPFPVGEAQWRIPAIPAFGDAYEHYDVALAEGRYACTCYAHNYGDRRQHRICSHAMAVAIYRRLHPERARWRRPTTRPTPLTEVDQAPKVQEPELEFDDPEDMISNGLATEAEVIPEHGITPADLLLPTKFGAFREVQIVALERILASPKRWVFVQAPTGSGKSLIAAALQRLDDKSLLYTCHNKDLQNQFVRDFSQLCTQEEFAVELKGRDNYPTRLFPQHFPKISCGDCTKRKTKGEEGNGSTECKWCGPPSLCPYVQQKRKAYHAKIAVLNLAMFLSEANFVGQFGESDERRGKWPRIIIDEADMLEDVLMSFVELTISSRMIQRLGLEPPRFKTKTEAWVAWAEQIALPKVQQRLHEIDEQLDRLDDWDVQSLILLKEQKDLQRLSQKLAFFLDEIQAGNWVNCTEHHEEGPWVFKPVFVAKYGERYLWRHGERFVLMSATIMSKEQLCRNLGIPVDEAELVDLPSTFPAKHRPIYFVPGLNLSHKTKDQDWPVLVERLDQILDRHPEERTLVHTVSYALSRYVLQHSRHAAAMLTYESARTRDATLTRFKAGEARILLAPSMERGVDLPDHLCRVVVVLKVPYPNLGDKQVSARLYGARDGQAWYNAATARALVQMTGRGVRHAEDHCISYILDGQFGRLYREWRRIFPRWWTDALHVDPL